MLSGCSTVETGTRCWVSNPGLGPPGASSLTAGRNPGGKPAGRRPDREVPAREPHTARIGSAGRGAARPLAPESRNYQGTTVAPTLTLSFM